MSGSENASVPRQPRPAKSPGVLVLRASSFSDGPVSALFSIPHNTAPFL